MLQGRLISDQS